MNKKILLLTCIGLLLVGVVTAVLVGGISNTVTSTVSVESPIYVEWTQEPTGDYTGGTIEFETTALNRADRDVEIYNQLTEIHAPVGSNWEGSEFDAINVDDADVPLSCVFFVKDDGTLDAWANVGDYDTNVARIWMDSDCDGVLNTYTHGAESTATSHVIVTTNVAMQPTDYEIKVCYVLDFSETC